MGKELELAFLQRRYENGQAHEKKFNIVIDQGNAIQYHNEITHTTGMTKKLKIIIMGKLEQMHITGMNVKWCSHSGKQPDSSSKGKIVT